MKVTLDLDQLLERGDISAEEYAKLRELGAKSTATLGLMVLIGFGVIAVALAAIALAPTPVTAIGVGLCLLVPGMVMMRGEAVRWHAIGNLLMLVGTLMAGGGLLVETKGSLWAYLLVAVLQAGCGVYTRSGLLTVFSMFTLSGALGSMTAYQHASYYLAVQEPSLSILVFTVLSIALYQWSHRLDAVHARLALMAARAGVFLVNLGFWIGSLWGDRTRDGVQIAPDWVFAILWALALLATGVWAWRANRRWVLNVVAVFAGIHFYTQWFEHLGASPGSVLIAGLLTLTIAMGLRRGLANAQEADKGQGT